MSTMITSRCTSCTSTYQIPRSVAEAKRDGMGWVRVRCPVCDSVWSADCGTPYTVWVIMGDNQRVHTTVPAFQDHARVVPLGPEDLDDLAEVGDDALPDVLVFGPDYLEHRLVSRANLTTVALVLVTDARELADTHLPEALGETRLVPMRWDASLPATLLPRFGQPSTSAQLVILFDLPRPPAPAPDRTTVIDELGLSDDFLSDFFHDDDDNDNDNDDDDDDDDDGKDGFSYKTDDDDDDFIDDDYTDEDDSTVQQPLTGAILMAIRGEYIP